MKYFVRILAFLFISFTSLYCYTLEEALWGKEECSSSASCSCYASIEQYEFIKLLRDHCTFKPWKIRKDTNCAEFEYVKSTFNLALEHFRKLAKVIPKLAFFCDSNIPKFFFNNFSFGASFFFF